jgi:6-phosphogluconolactonase
MIETYPSERAWADAAADAAASVLKETLQLRGRASLVATGGRSPGPVYDRLRAAPLAWSRIVVTLSDERCVAETDPASNARLVRQRLLQEGAARAQFLPLWPAPPAAAIEALRPFDMVLLGMGEDGHIASLIPGDPGLEDALSIDEPLRVVPPGLGSPPLARITLTLATLVEARAIFLLISGEAKREVVRRALAGDDLPVARLLSQSQAPVRIFWRPGDGV